MSIAAPPKDIVAVVSRYIHLQPMNGIYVGLCPFHKGVKPSLFVSPEQQIYYCPTCSESGDVTTFLMKAEGLSYADALQFLENHSAFHEQKDRQRMLHLCKDAACFFRDMLQQKSGQLAQQYFQSRGLNKLTIQRFGLGYAPDSFHSLLDAMRKKGYSKEEVLAAGLACQNEKGQIYDRFRGRVMFPIFDIRNNVTGFGGRVLNQDKPKYLNSPGTLLFHKSNNLFALNRAKRTTQDFFILAEGYMDVLALHQAGFDSAVASLGTSLTEQQANILARYTQKVFLAYDADEPGQNAAKRATKLLQQAGLAVCSLQIPGAKDPDEFIRQNGSDAFQTLLMQSA